MLELHLFTLTIPVLRSGVSMLKSRPHPLIHRMDRNPFILRINCAAVTLPSPLDTKNTCDRNNPVFVSGDEELEPLEL